MPPLLGPSPCQLFIDDFRNLDEPHDVEVSLYTDKLSFDVSVWDDVPAIERDTRVQRVSSTIVGVARGDACIYLRFADADECARWSHALATATRKAPLVSIVPYEQVPAERRLLNTNELQRELGDSMTYEEGEMLSSDGKTLLFTQQWLVTKQAARGLVFIQSGYGQHGPNVYDAHDNYFRLVVALVRAGYHVFSHDRISHGRSGGVRLYLPSFELLIEDSEKHVRETLACLEEAEARAAQLPIALVGESMGGAISLNMSLRAKSAGAPYRLALIAPMVRIEEKLKPNAVMLAILKAAMRVVPMRKQIPSILDKVFSTQEAYERTCADVLTDTSDVMLATAFQMLIATEELHEKMESVRADLLVLHGEHDDVTPLDASCELIERCSSENKKLITYPGVYHGMLMEDAETVQNILDDLIDFLNQKS